MAKELKVGGRMNVDTLKKRFKETFGVNIRVYNGARFAQDKATLASIRADDAKGGEFSIHGRTKVGKVEKEFKEKMGIKIQVENAQGELADDDISLSQASKS